MASMKPPPRYASFDCRSSTSSHHSEITSDLKNSVNRPSSLKHLMGISSGRRREGSDANNTRLLSRTNSADVLAQGKTKNGQNFGILVKKFMEKKSKKPTLLLPPDYIKNDLKKAAGKGSNYPVISKKLFQTALGPSKTRSETKALSDLKDNTRTLGMVLKSERELLSQNMEYEKQISELQQMLEQKNKEVDKLKDLCLKHREEIKDLKNASLFPTTMNSQLHEVVERQGLELKQAQELIPSLQEQVTSLTRQLKCIAEDLAEVKLDKHAGRSLFNGHVSSPSTPIYNEEAPRHLEFSSDDILTPGASLEEMFLMDLNPCLTPRFVRAKEFGERTCYDFSGETVSGTTAQGYSKFCNSDSRKQSKSLESCHSPGMRSVVRIAHKSEDRQNSFRRVT